MIDDKLRLKQYNILNMIKLPEYRTRFPYNVYVYGTVTKKEVKDLSSKHVFLSKR
jgi:hypothetical protein